VAGWQLRHFEPGRIYHVFHAEGAHRRRLSLKTTRWLLVLRLIYAEKRERLEATLTRHPTVTVGEVYERYLAFFPGQKVREKTSLDEALRTLQGLRLIRAAGGGYLRAADTDKALELLPALEVVVPAQAIAEVADRLREYQAEPADDAEGDPESLDQTLFVPDGKSARPRRSLRDELKRRPPARYYDHIHEYQADLLNRLGGLNERFFDLFLRALHFKPISRINDFVEQWLLEKKELNLESLQTVRERLRDLKSEAERVESRIAALDGILA
jgi:hypothetical protein